MSKFYFHEYIDYEDGKMAHVNTIDEYDIDEIPLNIHIDNADQFPDLKNCECEIDVAGVTGDIEVYPTPEAYHKSDPVFDEKSLIPAGTFSLPGNEDTFKPSADILFTGLVLDVKWNPDRTPEEPNCCILIETLGFTFSLYLEYNGEINEGNIVSGAAWLFGEIENAYPEDEFIDNLDLQFDDEDAEYCFSEENPRESLNEKIRSAVGSYVRLTCKNTGLCACYEGRLDEYNLSDRGDWNYTVQGQFLRVGRKSFYIWDIQAIEIIEGIEADVLRGKITGETIQDYIFPLTDEQLVFLAAELKIDLEDLPFLAKDKIGDVYAIIDAVKTEEANTASRENREVSDRGRTAADIVAMIKEELDKHPLTNPLTSKED